MLAKAAAAAGIVSGSMGLAQDQTTPTTTSPTSDKTTTSTKTPEPPKQQKVCDLDGMCRLISTYEGQGNEEKIRKVHRDSKGLLTLGRGHLVDTSIVPEKESLSLFSTLFPEEHKTNEAFGADLLSGKASLTDDQIQKLLRHDVEKRLPKVVEYTGEGYWDMPSSLQNELAAEYFRGGLGLAKKTRELIRSGEYGKAATEYLDSREYRDSLAARGKRKPPEGGWNDIANRYQRLSQELTAHQAAIDKKKAEEEAKKKAGQGVNPPEPTPNPTPERGTTPNENKTPEEEFYEVKSGDTSFAIARRHGLSLEELGRKNPQIKNLGKINPTDRLRIR